MAARKKGVDFEKSLGELEALVTELEKGDMSLEESLKAFEDGIKLTRECQTRLTEAEQKVQMLIEEQGELKAVPFEDSSRSSAEGSSRNSAEGSFKDTPEE